MKDYSIDRKYAVLMQADSSFGGQPKFKKDDICFSCTISGSFEKQFLLAKESTGYEPFKIDYDKLSLLLGKYPDSIAKNYLEYSLEKYKNIFKQNKEIDNLNYSRNSI